MEAWRHGPRLRFLVCWGLDAVWAELRHRGQTGTPIEEASLVKQNVPQGILDSILNEAAGLAKVPREQLVIVRAESVVWNAARNRE